MQTRQCQTTQQSARDGLALTEANETTRRVCAETIAAEYAGAAIPENRRRGAEMVLRLFADDAAESVRAAVAHHLAACPHLPRSLARQIAEDVDAIAMMMIRTSPVLEDADLLEIVRSGVVARQVAVASRPAVSLRVSNALVGTRELRVVKALMANDGARISEADLCAVLDAFEADPAIADLFVRRAALPLAVIDRLLGRAGLEMRDLLESALGVPGPIVRRICSLAHEQLVVGHVRDTPGVRAVADLAGRLAEQGRISPTLALRALCTGDVQFFAICVAARAGVPGDDVRDLVQRGDHDRLAMVYDATGWPSSIGRAFAVVLKVYGREKDNIAHYGADAFTERAVDRLIREFSRLNPGSLDAVLAQIVWRLL
jgi:uncharacterized protein (DUF2336 family)